MIESSRSPDRAGPCRVALVGAGYTAREHARAFADILGVQLVGVHSRTRARAEALAAEFGIAVVADSVRALWDATQAHLVVVTVPELAMRPVVEACVGHPWTLLIEKPPGYCIDDARRLGDAAAEHESGVFVALNRRFLSSTQAVLRGLEEAPDSCRYIHVRDQQDQAAARNSGQPVTVVENWMFANSIHTVDYLRLLGRGEVTEVRCHMPWNAADPGIVLSEVRFASGDIGIYEAVWNGPGPWAVSVSVTDYRWELRPLEHAVEQRRGEPPRDVPVARWDVEFKPGFRAQAEAAIATAMGRPSRSVALREAMETMEIIGRAYSIDASPLLQRRSEPEASHTP